ncbi:MAG: hypothetical protein ACYDCM_07250 [Candidatus Acidiferrales bacterium]
MSTIQERAQFASRNFEVNFSELISHFDPETITKAILAWCRVEAVGLVDPESTTDDFEDLIETAFATLFRRGAIAPIRPLDGDGVAQKQLDGLLKVHPAPVPVKAPEPEADTLVEIVNDFRTLRTADFNRKVYENKDNYQKRFEAAVASGRI